MNTNWGMIGHEWAVQLLKGHLMRGEPRHAYLFSGPSGVGRRTLALRFAQAINAENPPAAGDFDPQTRTSQQFENMQHPDLSLIERQEGDRDIKIDALRQLQRNIILAPYMAKYRIALLLNFEEANPYAANAILKTLEEPPPRVVMLLTAVNAEALLPTLSSRCEVIKLRRVPLQTLEAGLMNQYNVEDKKARLLAHISNGCPGYAIRLNREKNLMERRVQWLDEQQQLLLDHRIKRFNYARKVVKEKEVFIQQLQVWLSYWRDVLLHAMKATSPLTNQDRLQEITEVSEKVGAKSAEEMVKRLEGTIHILRTNVNLRLAAEVLLLDMPYMGG